MQKKLFNYGFSLIELLIVIAIIAFLTALSAPSFFKFLAKSKRSEAHITLRSLYIAQKAYWMEHASYTNKISGPASLGWKPEGTLQYTYGFSGAEGTNCVIGALKTPGSALAPAKATANEFIIVAAGDIDGDGNPDVLTIDHNGVIKIVADDLAD